MCVCVCVCVCVYVCSIRNTFMRGTFPYAEDSDVDQAPSLFPLQSCAMTLKTGQGLLHDLPELLSPSLSPAPIKGL